MVLDWVNTTKRAKLGVDGTEQDPVSLWPLKMTTDLGVKVICDMVLNLEIDWVPGPSISVTSPHLPGRVLRESLYLLYLMVFRTFINLGKCLHDSCVSFRTQHKSQLPPWCYRHIHRHTHKQFKILTQLMAE